MCKVTRRDLLKGSAALLGTAVASEKIVTRALAREVGKVDTLAPDVYFHEGNLAVGHCNNGWVVFEDYVLVIDANFPSGAHDILPKIKAITDKPVRFAFDTHHHGDHAYGNQVWVENGATPLAHTGVVEELKRYETGYYDSKPGRWEESAKSRPDVKASRLKPPSVLFPKQLIFDDGKHRVELIHLGIAHTHGDAVAWLPKERILFTGDVCVNGPYNYVGDGDVEKWVATLEGARQLGATAVCPGHGPRGEQPLLGDQQAFFQALREQVGAMVKAKKAARDVQAGVDQISDKLSSDARIKRYVSKGSIGSQIEKVYTEMTGEKFPAQKTARAARAWHAHSHGVASQL
jgi:glyoxylase-like metal-dependent hydrolase (beta-lactamase superfamily II)